MQNLRWHNVKSCSKIRRRGIAPQLWPKFYETKTSGWLRFSRMCRVEGILVCGENRLALRRWSKEEVPTTTDELKKQCHSTLVTGSNLSAISKWKTSKKKYVLERIEISCNGSRTALLITISCHRKQTSTSMKSNGSSIQQNFLNGWGIKESAHYERKTVSFEQLTPETKFDGKEMRHALI